MTDETISVTVELTPEEVGGLRRIAPHGYSDGEPTTPEGAAIRKIFEALPPREPKVGERWLPRHQRTPSSRYSEFSTRTPVTILAEFSTIHGEKCIVVQSEASNAHIRSLVRFMENAEYLDDGGPDA